MLHRPSLPGDFPAALLDLFAGLVGIVNLDRDMAIAIAQVVLCRVPVMRELKHGLAGLIPVADERQGEPAVRVVPLP
jgi:hypothetical protein